MKQDSDFCDPLNIEWFSQKQWSYLQRRYHVTPRELQIAKIVCCRGLNNKEIAKELNIAHNTVKIHLRSIYGKIRSNSKVLMLLRFIEDVKNLKQSA